jgi:hypothetical protein
MKTLGLVLGLSLFLASGGVYARGPATSSFAPRGPEPHATLADKNGRQGSSHKGSHRKPGGAAKHGPAHRTTKPS